MLAHVPSFGQNPRGSADFLAYPVPKGCMHVLGTGVPRCLGVARSASSPKAAQACGCSLTPSLRISFGWVTCMARAASVPGLWTLGFLLLRGACVCVWVVVGFGFQLRPATPGWGVGVCVRLCVRSACTLPLLARVCGVGVCGWVGVLAAPRHSWLGCRGLCLLVCALRLHPATPRWGARRGCVCLGSGFGCTPPLMAGVLGCVCAGVGALLAPRHSPLGCAPWVCVFGLGFRLRPATPGWGVGVCVCSCACPPCTPPLLAQVCGVGVCVWARVSAEPRHSWLGCWGVCVLVCVLLLWPASPGWGLRLGCVCLVSGFGCAPPLLAGLLGCMCARVRAPLAPCHSWLGCAVCVCGFGLGFRLRPATPGWGVGLCVCSCARSACSQPLLAGVCVVGVCAGARGSAAPRHSWLGCWAVCVLVCALRLHPTTPGWGSRCGCVCLGSGFGCAPPLLAGVLGCVNARVRAPFAPSLSWHGCAVWVCVFGLGLRLRPATPGWGVGVCVCWCVRSACSPPLLAQVRAVGVCVWARVWAAPCQSWLGCWAVCVLVWALRLHPATSGRGARCGCVCLDSGFGCAAPLLAGVLGCVCARVHAPFAPIHSWHGCAVWVCVFGLGFRLRPATPGLGVRCGCVCWGSGFGCAPQLLAGPLGCVCARVRTPLAPRPSRLWCAVCVCVYGLWFRLRPATPGWGVGLCLCSCARSVCTQPLLARVRGVRVCVWARVSAVPRHSWLGCWGVCVLVCALRLHPATPGWGARRGCVCLGSGLGCAPPVLAGVLGCVCPGVGAPLTPGHSWLGCAPWVCVFGLGFRLHPATPGRGVGLCVCSCGCFACTPPLLAGVRAVHVCVWARFSAAPRHSWLGCWGVCVLVWALRLHPATPGWGARSGCVCLGLGFDCTPPLLAGVMGCVCAGVGALLAPRDSWLGCAPWMCVFGLGFRLRPATLGWNVGVCVCSCACPPCTPPLLAGVCGVGVCLWARVWAAPRHSWLGCWGVCVLVCVLLLYPASPGWGVRCGCVCLGSGFGCAPPLLAGVLAVCVLVCALRLHPAIPGWGARCGCVCLGSGFGCTPPLLAWVLGRVCARVGAPLAPVHS